MVTMRILSITFEPLVFRINNERYAKNDRARINYRRDSTGDFQAPHLHLLLKSAQRKENIQMQHRAHSRGL